MLKTERRALIDLITAQRKRLGMTQAELAEAAGVARKTVNNMEAGRTDGQDATVARMARAVGLDREPDLDESTRSLLAVLGPLIQRIPEADRAVPVAQCVAILSSAIPAQPAQVHPSGPRLTILSDDDLPTDLEDMPYAADMERPGDDPGEDD